MTIVRTDEWIQTYNSGIFTPLDPKPEQIELSNIAHALSMLCRYGGHCNIFYSVAQHCCYCFDMAGTNEQAFEALMHDASEAYLIDMPRPIKMLLPDYRAMEKRLEEVIAKKYNLPFPISPEVKVIDNRMLATEKLQIMDKAPMEWMKLPEPYDIKIESWSPDRAEYEFRWRFDTVA